MSKLIIVKLQKEKTTRVGYKMEGDKKVRFSTKSNEVI